MDKKHSQVLAGLTILLAMPAVSQPKPSLAGFKAYLFNSKTGQLSQNVLGRGAPKLGNVPAGEFSSVSTLVVVQVELGEQAPVPDKAQIRLVATESGSIPFATKDGKSRDRTILDRTSSLGPVNDHGTSYVGFWLDHTGCRTIALKAYLVGAGDAPPLNGVLPFTCYE